MIKVGITGNIGSGKSTVAKVFHSMGVPLFISDIEAKKLMVEDPSIIEQIKNTFGEEAYFLDNILNRNYIAQIVFKDIEMLHKLNQIVHPAIEKHFIQWCEKFHHETYILKEAAILFESGTYASCDKVITIACDHDTAVKRAALRDKKNISEIEKRLNKQMPQEEKISKSDFVIWNNDGDEVLPQVMAIHQKIMSISNI